ncbi:AAA family ATPase [Elizabethkingia anophelis]|uniref:AAA family ATPase n=1 Tax=Elizabethkingia anophelis TaxID=1117645 RepID=UPI0020111A30|nr:AAA family ATPase [Elizabethkingia anophelis]EJC8061996.1 AAA family ATPase [Elizabethkingia anophelis]MCL1643507.1 AAA family ATPase [Elizabethkingia anophelis]MCL1646520.1 AAA family ATPase [Elizabethkingia anophelis]MCT4035646.1 AAA family ATPase [Elizabethkingia anophelis]MDV3779111.1 hypothetical protein [Elizabethkingia anophelis]
MKLKYRGEYFSIKKFDDIKIDDFSIITGLNGSGKSHLLNAINNGSIQIEGIDIHEIVLYNYDDFKVFNFDLNQSSQHNYNFDLKNKYEDFQVKKSNYSQNINNKKRQLLESFTIDHYYENIYLDTKILNIFPNNSILQWNEEDTIAFEKIKNTPVDLTDNNLLSSMPYLLYSYINTNLVYNNIDIRQFIISLKKLYLYTKALYIIRNFNYSFEYLIFENEKDQIVLISELLSKNININLTDDLLKEKYSNKLLNFFEKARFCLHPYFNVDYPYIEKIINEIIPNIYNELVTFIKKNLDSLAIKQLTKTNGDIDFIKNIEIEDGFFNLKEIEQEEKNYQIVKKNNQYQEFLNLKGENTNFHSEEEFLEIYGESPINILNKVLEEYDCNGYELRWYMPQINLGIDINTLSVDIKLFNKTGNFETNIEHLSSGEKTILALAFSIYKLRKNKIIAKLFLMDEIDSALHPQMSKRLLNVLYNYFYKELGINIIISTHSPSTVAFSPENSLLIMRKEEEPRLIKVNKDSALRELTLGVPSFSINYENRRQIFVESKYDVEYYESIYNIFKDKLNNDISLNFIASGDVQKNSHGQANSSCNIVKKVTETLRDAGNNSIFGIVDWDLSSGLPKNNFIKVLGFDARYSIENFILDPLLIGILLMREKINNYKPEYFGLEKSLTLNELLNLDTKQCQKIIDKITSDFISKKEIKVNHKFHYNTIGNYNLQIPDFIKNMQGHKLEEWYKDIYPELRGIAKNGENHFKNTVISKIFEDFKNFVPSEILKVLKDVQEI